MKALITGVTGQIGSYLAELLVQKGYEVFGLVRRNSSLEATRKRIDHLNLNLVYGDLADFDSVHRVVSEVKPDEIYNLAAQSHVGISFKIPEYTGNIDALGVLRVCEAVRRVNKNIKIYQASTSELFGGVYNRPVTEKDAFYPKSPYGVAKLYGYWIMKTYREGYGMFCSNGIVFNSESPRRGENFVTRKITIGVANILKGDLEKIELGNLNAKRDWNHAKDTAKAMWLVLQHKKADDFVIGSGETHSVREFVELAFKHVGIDISWKGEGLDEKGFDPKTGREYVSVNPEYFRPAEVDVLIADPSKAQKELGWKPEHSFQDLVKEMMDTELK